MRERPIGTKYMREIQTQVQIQMRNTDIPRDKHLQTKVQHE